MTPFEVADALRVCLDAQEWGEEKPAEICHRPGSLVPLSVGLTQDECCSGLAWVRIQSIEPVADPLASQERDYNPCQSDERRVTFELGVARCNPFGDANAGPSCADWTALALRVDQDAAVMRKAVCCFNSSGDVDEYGDVIRVKPGTWTPLDSSGGCAGGTMEVVVWMTCGEC